MDGVKLYRRQWYPIKSMYLVPNYIGVNNGNRPGPNLLSIQTESQKP